MPAPQLHNEALDRLGQDIVDGRQAIGSVLTLADLEARFRVSRTVAREIMRVLEALGMVRSRRRVGITIRPRSEWNVLDPLIVRWRLTGSDRQRVLVELAELRGALQPTAAAQAALQATRDQRIRLVELADLIISASARADGAADEVEAEIEFHTLLLKASANELFAAVAGLVSTVQGLLGSQRRPAAGQGPQGPVRYRRIAVAIASGDEDQARRYSIEQVGAFRTILAEEFLARRAPKDDRPGVEGWSV